MVRRAFPGTVLSVVLGVLVVHAAAGAVAAEGAARQRPKVTLELRARTGYAYRWEYNVVVRVRGASTGKPFASLRVTTSGLMDLPGHHMTAGPSRLRAESGGVYRSRLAFYMPGKWQVRSRSTAQASSRRSRASTSY